MSTLTQPVELFQGASAPGGLLSVASPLPEGWEAGGVEVPFYGCGEPILRDKCVAGVDEPHQGGVARFPAFPIEQGAVCSSLSKLDTVGHASQRLRATAEWALAKQLLDDSADTGAPSLADATLTNAPGAAALPCLEAAAAEASFGAPLVFHMNPATVLVLASSRWVWRDPAGTLRTMGSNSPIIVSGAYPSRVEGEPLQMPVWVTGRVWAGLGPIDTWSDPPNRRNYAAGWAMATGGVAFDPCINIEARIIVPASFACNPPA